MKKLRNFLLYWTLPGVCGIISSAGVLAVVLLLTGDS
jgi:hypothetical protein